MNGYTDDPLISSLLNQPIIVWSLVISATIFVLAIGLATIFKLRNRAKLRQAEKLAAENTAKEAHAAAKEQTGNIGDQANPSRLDIDSGESVTQDDTLVSETSGTRTLATAVSGNEAKYPAQIVGVTNTDVEKGNAESEEPDSSKSALASIFEDEIIVDLHIQALRDNLPDIDMSKLQEDAQLVISRFLERGT